MMYARPQTLQGMNINLRIERLILEGIDLAPSQRALVQATVERELSRLLAVNGIPQPLEHGGNLPSPISINVSDNLNPQQMGQGIAQNIYKTMQSSNRNWARYERKPDLS